MKLLRQAYTEATNEDARLSASSVHEIRVLAAYLAVQSTFALSDILRATTWASPSTFALSSRCVWVTQPVAHVVTLRGGGQHCVLGWIPRQDPTSSTCIVSVGFPSLIGGPYPDC